MPPPASYFRGWVDHHVAGEGTNRAGFGARLARAVGDAGINLRGFTGSVIGRKFVCFLGFDRPEDAAAAADAIRALEPVPTATPAAQAS